MIKRIFSCFGGFAAACRVAAGNAMANGMEIY
jgi:hypothetical protein